MAIKMRKVSELVDPRRESFLDKVRQEGIIPEWLIGGGEALHNATNALTQGMTLGFGDEAAAAGAATGGWLKDKVQGRDVADLVKGGQPSWGDRYNTAVDQERQGLAGFAQRNPKTSLGLNILGGIGSLGVTPGAAAPMTTAQAVRTGAATGAGLGAATGFGSGEGGLGNRAVNAGIGGVVGGALGAAVPAIIAGGSKLLGGMQQRPAPSLDELHDTASQLYTKMRASGVRYTSDSFDDLLGDVAQYARDPGQAFFAENQPKSFNVLRQMVSASGSDPSIAEMQMFRKMASNVIDDTLVSNPADARFADAIIDHIDDYIERAANTPSMVLGGDAPGAHEMLGQANQLWSRYKKAELVEKAITRALDRAETTYTGGNVANAVKQNIRAILDNPKKLRGFSKEEVDMLRAVISSGGGKLVRTLAATSPTRGGLMALLHMFGGASFGIPSAALGAAGAATDFGSRAATRMSAQQLAASLRAGQSVVPQLPPQLQLMMQGLLQGGAGGLGNMRRGF